jgi:N-methylhydantoinase A
VFARRDREAIKRLFDEMHQQRYGTSAPAESAEIVSLRATVAGVMRKPPLLKIRCGAAAPSKSAFAGRRRVHFDGSFRSTPVWHRAALVAGNRVKGPAVIEEHASTTVLMPGDTCEVDAWGNLRISVGGRRASASS